MDIVGPDVLSIRNLGSIVNEVVEECAGWPLAVVTTAESLKGAVDYCEWKTALEGLKAPQKWPLELKIRKSNSLQRVQPNIAQP